MSFDYCGQTDELSDAEILALVRMLCGEKGEAEEVSMLRLPVQCDLSKGHLSLHASLQVMEHHNDTVWFRWRGPIRDFAYLAGSECPQGGDDVHVGCLLYEGHPGEHCCPESDDPGPSWCR